MKTMLKALLVLGVMGLLMGYTNDEHLQELKKRSENLRAELNLVDAEIESLTGKNTEQILAHGKQQFEAVCAACHLSQPNPGNMVAPPVFAVQMHYRGEYETPGDFAKAIAQWATKPDVKKSHMPGAIERFGLMPPMPIGEKNLEAIGKYLFQAEFNRGQGCGRGRGQGRRGC